MISEFRNLSFGQKDEKYIRLYHGDCVEGISTHIQENSVKVVVTSPPYKLRSSAPIFIIFRGQRDSSSSAKFFT